MLLFVEGMTDSVESVVKGSAAPAAAVSDGSDNSGSSSTSSTYGYAHSMEYVNDFRVARYEKENGKNWDRFYSKGKKGYLASTRNREYLNEDLAADLVDAAVLLEVGCGGGHSIAPLAKTLPKLRFLAVDVSPKAVDILRANPDVPQERCEAYACDVQHEELPRPTCPIHGTREDSAVVKEPDDGWKCCCAGVDCALLVFVMSSITPEAHCSVLEHIKKVLTPGGVVLFRDYARGDANQLDFDKQYPPRKLAPNFYVRPDGTRAYFFDLNEVCSLFDRCGFDRVRAEIITFKKRTNDRFFVNAKFRLRS